MVTAGAVVMGGYGGSDVLQMADVDLPEPGPGEALLRVLAVSVNHLDVDIRNGSSRMPLTLPHVLGREVVGEVERLGDGVDVPAGGRHVVLPNAPCGACTLCFSGRANLCRNAYMPGITGWGGYAERIVVPARALFPIGDMPVEVAAATPISFGTAWRMLYSVGRLQPGDKVLVSGAAGGLGHAAVQLAKLCGAYVVGLIGDPAKSDFVLSCGADAVISARTAEWATAAREASGGDGFDVIVEHVGAEVFEKAVELLTTSGRLLIGGGHAGEHPSLDLITAFRQEVNLIGVRSQRPDEIARVLELAATGQIRPRLDRVLPLEQAAAAHDALTARQVLGKQVLLP